MEKLFEALKESWLERGELIKLLSEGRLDEAKQFIEQEDNCFQKLWEGENANVKESCQERRKRKRSS